VFGAKETKKSTKGTKRTCWRELESSVEGGKKRVDSKKVTLADI